MYEITRKTLIITTCLMLSKLLHLHVTVYIVLFGIVIATSCYSKHVLPLLARVQPSVLSAIAAVFVNQLFAIHPFVIWCCCILYFDFVRRRATNNLKIRQATLPLFMIIFVTTYHNSTGYALAIPTIIRDVVLSSVIAAIVASIINHIMPIRGQTPKPKIIPLEVTGLDRLKMLLLVGGGLAFVMINEVTTAVFCLVPLITSAMQPTHGMMKSHSRSKMLSQIGGCSLAVIISMLYSGTEVDLFTYGVISYGIIYTIIHWISNSSSEDTVVHSDALMGFLIPYQLYIGKYGNDFGLNSIALRAFELMLALMIIYTVAHWMEWASTRHDRVND